MVKGNSTIILAIHNIAKRGLDRAYFSCLSLSLQTIPVQVIVMDSSKPVHFEKLNKLISKFKNVKHIHTREKEFNLCRLFNKGILSADTEYIGTTGADFLFGPDFFESLEFTIDRHGKDTMILKQVRSLAMKDEISDRSISEWDFPERPYTFKGSKDACGGIQYAHRDLWTEINGYDNRMKYWGGMDEDIRNRCKRWKKVHWMKESIFYHIPHETEKFRNSLAMRQMKKNWQIKDSPRPRFIKDGLNQIDKNTILWQRNPQNQRS